MSHRFLLGPVSKAWVDEHLSAGTQATSCTCIDWRPPADLLLAPDQTWDSLQDKLPDTGPWDAFVLHLAQGPVPSWVWQVPIPLIALLPEWREHWHVYRQIAQHCDLVLTDEVGAAALRAEKIDHVRAVRLAGIGRSWLNQDQSLADRDIDVLVVGGSHPFQERDTLPSLPRLAALRTAWKVVVAPVTQGNEYRQLVGRAHILLALDNPAQRAAEAAAAGALFFQNHRACDGQLLQDREECVCFDESNLEVLLSYYLRSEAERLEITANATRRLPELTFAAQWDKAWSDIVSELPALRERAAHRTREKKCPTLLTRAWLHLAWGDNPDPSLDEELTGVRKESPRDPHVHNMAGVLALRKVGHDNIAQARIDAANAFQDAWRSDPRHGIAGLNLCEVLMAMGQTQHAQEQARRTLAMLDRLQPSDHHFLEAPHAGTGRDEFGVEWQRAAWSNAGQPTEEFTAKWVLLRRRLHQLLGQLHDDVTHPFIACSLRPDLFVSQAWLGSTLLRKGNTAEAIPYLQQAVGLNPIDAEASRFLHQALGNMGHSAEQQQLARQRRQLSEAAPHLVAAEPWFASSPLPSIAASAKALNIAWQGAADALHSLALVNRELCARLVHRGHELSLQPPRADKVPATRLPLPPELQDKVKKTLPRVDFTIAHQWPPDFTPPREGHWIIMQPWEYGSLPKAWLEPMKNLVDDVWVPSHVVRDGFLRSGLDPDRVHVVPNGVADVFLQDHHPPLPLQTKKQFKFLFVGGTLERKGIDLLLKAYSQSFSAQDDVCLVIKDMGVGTFYQGQTAEKLVSRLREAPHAPEIEYLPRELTPEELAGLYLACNCLVHPYRGEGFGLPIAEAMACGLPVIVTGLGAALDFCREEHVTLLPARPFQLPHKQIGDIETVDRPWWAEPDVDALRLSLHRAIEQHDRARIQARKGQAFIREHFTWDHAASIAETRMQELKQRPIRRQRCAPAVVQAAGPRPRVSLTMIVKNEEANLAACLQSVADLVDEIIIVDTGSTDATKQIATNMKAKVFDFPWVDSFSAARNESLRHAKGEWIFWMDADDRLDEENRVKLKALFAKLPKENVGFVMKCLCLSETKSETVVDHVRLFRHHPEIRWSFRIHEQILPAIRKLGGDVRWSDVVIRHVGYVDGGVRKGKLERDLRLLTLEFQEQPENPFTLFNLASVYQEQGRMAEALDFFQRSLQRSAPEDSIVRKLYAQIVQCQRHLGQAAEALRTCQAGRRHYPHDLEILFQEALAHREVGNRTAAIASLERILTHREGTHFASVDTGLRGYKTRHNLAVFLQEEGRLDEAEKHWRAALAEQPSFLPAQVGLVEITLARADWPAFDRAVARLRQTGGAEVEALVLQARKHLALREFGEARATIDRAIAQAPQAVSPRIILTHILLQQDVDWFAAEKALCDVLAMAPNHAESRRNLDLLLRQQGKSPSA